MNVADMVFARRVLHAFCGMRLLQNKKLMCSSLTVFSLGYLLRLASEISAYEANLHAAWTILLISALTG